MAELREACATKPEAILVLGAAKAAVCRSRAERAIDAMSINDDPGYQLMSLCDYGWSASAEGNVVVEGHAKSQRRW